MATNQQTIEQLNKIFSMMEDMNLREQVAAEELNKLKIDNAKRLAALQIELLNKKAVKEEELQHKLNEYYLREGISKDAVLLRNKHQEKLRAIDEELNLELQGKSKAEQKLIKQEFEARRKAIEEEFDQRLGNDKELRKVIKKLDDKEARERKKQKEKELKEGFGAAANALGGNLGSIFQGRNINKARNALEDQGITDEKEQNKYIKAAQADAVYKALAGFAKQLENTATEVAEAQEMIDTRMQGSSAKSSLGSYWKSMSDNITKNIAMSPFIKQADAVNNLKNLVGKGIAFNVEQRAFLDTISEKIATTFEATDASLLKLVRIQQADSTAARLGMESALTAFLNNMYETTEYMTEAADAIRGSIYEASALMSAEEATEFEYQVQKWMGSLYSVGFNSTQGLADALGKLAAGDISGITDGGFGNLLVMAANQTGDLSIAEILQDGLNNDETNKLMQAMVEYLGNIYEETKSNKVVAQQFANVYGLTASDLKAAANLAQSTQSIYKNNEFSSYEQMLGRLTDMANSMGSRTAAGTMINNVFENLKYSTAASIGTDPVLYSTYMIASMLDDTVGGIAIPTIGAWAMGNGTEIDLETTVADIMRTGAMAGGLLGGIGKMLVGLGNGGGFSGSGMLEAFGVNTKEITTITRGTGTGIGISSSGTSISTSGFAGNENADDIINSTVAGEQDKAKQKAEALQEEQREIGLANVDEHVVQIHTLLQEVVSGTYRLHVINDSTDSWTSEYSPSGVPRL